MPRQPENKSGKRLQRASADLLREVFRGFMRVHVLHHASESPIFGLEMIDELRRHGYSIGPGTLYPMLHALEDTGALRSSQVLVGGKNRRYYRTTKIGDAMLAELRAKVREVFDEVLEESSPTRDARAAKARLKASTGPRIHHRRRSPSG